MLMLDLDNVNAALDAAVEEKGANFVYTQKLGCAYVHGIKNEFDGDIAPDFSEAVPGCIVGNVLHRMGIDFPTMVKPNAWDNRGTGSTILLNHLRSAGVLEYTEEARVLLSYAQSCQDDGQTWGRSVEYARNHVHDLAE